MNNNQTFTQEDEIILKYLEYNTQENYQEINNKRYFK